MTPAGDIARIDHASIVVIPARSQRQAMDWSLVLASQGIDTSIEHDRTAAVWGLAVASSEYERSVAAIRQYRLENRRWAWRQTLPESGLTWHGGALIWCACLIMVHWLVSLALPGLGDRGVMKSSLVQAGEWWRVFTAMWLHSDVGHLSSNAATGLVLLGLAMARYGGGLALLAAFFAGAAGNLASLTLHPDPFWGLGASGVVMGALGLVAAQSFSLWRASPRAGRYILAGAGAGGFLFLLLGTDPSSDVIAHTGGFLAGALLGALLSHLAPQTLQHPAVRMGAGLAFGLLVLLTWGLALR